MASQQELESSVSPSESWESIEPTFAQQVWDALRLRPGESKTREELQEERRALRGYIHLLLALQGYSWPESPSDEPGDSESTRLMRSLFQKARRIKQLRCPVDSRIEAFLAKTLGDVAEAESLRLPALTMILDRPGIARELSLPHDRDEFRNELVESYRVLNGVLHNPKHDRRTTVGTFHVVEGTLPVPGDKREVPRGVFARLYQHALKPPRELATFPYTSNLDDPAAGLVSLLVRPLVCPEVRGITKPLRMEIRFFVPGGLVSNLDFVESIFGNGGNPYDPECDLGLDVEHWTGHTGCVILAPHLLECRKKDLGLPHVSEATDRQKRDGMCWSEPDEVYNNGTPFKLTLRNEEGVVVTLIADNYFGYCKKEVKTQISYAANLFGNIEEEHAGGASAFQSFSLGDEFAFNSRRYNDRTLQDIVDAYPEALEYLDDEGYAIDRNFPQLKYVKEDAVVSIKSQSVSWTHNGQPKSIPLLPNEVYMGPSGYRVHLERHPAAPSWRLIGTLAEATFCHKPCTVSGGGKSEISKSLRDFMLYGPIFVADLEADLKRVDEIFERDYSDRWGEGLEDRPDYSDAPSRRVLDADRSLGSVIKLLTPSKEYNAEYNAWLESIPNYIYALVFIIKRFQRPDWDQDWRAHFSVDIVNGHPGHELKYDGRALVGQYLRVGLLRNRSWRTFKLRQDFSPAEKLQTEDDISVSVVVPGAQLGEERFSENLSYKFVTNCEYRLFQRPDEAINRGMDKQAEADLSQPSNFLSNFQPLTLEQVDQMVKHAIDLDEFTDPMKSLLIGMTKSKGSYVVCSSNPRLIGQQVSKNPRYLQMRPDLTEPQRYYIAEMGLRLYHGTQSDAPVRVPVSAVLFGRRNNAPDREQGIKGLCVYNPIHYQPLPELFMDFICSLSGKSPSTTGFGSEGALTKGPFNSLPPSIDLNSALVSYILTGLDGFSTPAGFVGPDFQVDHDISLLIPEVWCRMKPHERDARYLIKNGLLEPIGDFEFEGRTILASRLGYRITSEFVRRFVGKVFDNPAMVFDQPWLKPETQDPAAFAEGVEYITNAQQQVAQQYFKDGSYELACPPLQRLLTIMAEGQGAEALNDPELRKMFTREALLESDWYRQRLEAKARIDGELWRRKADYVEQYLAQQGDASGNEALSLQQRLALAQEQAAYWSSPASLESLWGTLGAEPLSR